DQSGHPHVLWIRGADLPDPSFDDDLFYSFFDGQVWSVPLNLSAGVTSGTESRTAAPAIAIDSIGRIHVVWTERIFPIKISTYHAIKTGGTWGQPTPITLPDYVVSEMVADNSGGLHLVTSPNGSEVYHSRFDGTQWISQTIVENLPDYNERTHLAI